MGLLEALRNGFGADAAGLFDDDRADGEQAGGLNFWESFGEQACGPADWESWYRTLRAQSHVDSACRCGRLHRLYGSMIHGRWALLVVVPPLLPPGGASAIASSLRALSQRLPPSMTAEERRQAALAQELDEAVPATRAPTDAPVWWIRKRTT
jgi:hypothetical protein